MTHQLKGKIYLKKDTQIVSDKFTKREFVIITDDQYPQQILLQLTQDKVGILDKYNIGDHVTANFNLRGREWKSPDGQLKYFNTLECYSLNQEGKPAPPPVTPHAPDAPDDLPF